MAPVNPSVKVSPPLEAPTPGVVDLVNPALKNEGEPVYTRVSDPGKRGFEDVTAPKDWNIHRPALVKEENPLPKPIAQVLMDHLRTVWPASSSAIQIEHVKNQLIPAQPVQPSEVPGDLAKEVLVYAPSKINKTENI